MTRASIRRAAPGQWVATRPRLGFGGPEVSTHPTQQAAARWLDRCTAGPGTIAGQVEQAREPGAVYAMSVEYTRAVPAMANLTRREAHDVTHLTAPVHPHWHLVAGPGPVQLWQLTRFTAESNAIEGIQTTRTVEIEAHQHFLAGDATLAELVQFVRVVADADLRRHRGMDVKVGSHLPPPGGPEVIDQLEVLLETIRDGQMTPYAAHHAYETLHPFTDGNGRSGRVLWAWHMRAMGRDPFALGFLHEYYYQSLSEGRP